MPSKLLKPRAIKVGDKLGVIALASAVQETQLEAGLSYLKSCGYKPKVALKPSAHYQSHKFLFSSDSAEMRLKALKQLFTTRDIKAILSVRGGYSSAQLLPDFNFSLAKKHPKIVVGFSDVSAILINLYQRAGLVCIHGPSLITAAAKLGNNLDISQSVEVLKKFLSGEIINPFERSKLERLTGGKKEVSGALTGGNLCTLVSLLGTEWEPNFDNHIVFFEETGEAPYRVHRLLLQLKLAGKFDKVRAVLLGDFSHNVSDRNGPVMEDVFRDIFKDYSFPVLCRLPIGHGDTNFPVPLGIKARIIQNKLEIVEQAVLK